MEEETIKWILTDTSVDPVSKVPISAVVFMLYYGLELKHFLLEVSNDILSSFRPGIRDYSDTSLYLAGSAAQGFYLNTNDFLDARDVDIVSILRKEVRSECEYDKNPPLYAEKREDQDPNENHGHCSCTLKENSTTESPSVYLNVETWDDTYPGYVMLRKCRKDELPVQTTLSHRYVSSYETTRSRTEYWNEIQSILADAFRSGLDEEWGNDFLVYEDVLTQGPAASSKFTNIFLDVQLNSDLVFALPYPGWPEIAKEWQERFSASGWPSLDVKEDIIKSGCLIVPKGHVGSRVEEYEWRISFSFAELTLSRTLNRIQREIVHVLKAFLSDKKEHEYMGIEAKLDSYFVINLLYTESEKIDIEEWTEINIAKLVFRLLDKLESNIKNKSLPHYFIPTNNLFHKYTFKSVKLAEGEFKRGYGEEGETMVIDEYIDFALYAVLRLRHDPLGQILSQSKYVQLTGSIRQAVFQPLVMQAISAAKVEGEMYFLTVLRLAKAHLFQLRFKEAYLYTEDSRKFYKALGEPEGTDNLKSDLLILRALSAYLAGHYDIAKEVFEEIEKEIEATKSELVEKNKGILSMIYARTLFSITQKHDRKDLLTMTDKLFQSAVGVSCENSRAIVCLDFVNYFMRTSRYEDALEILNEIKHLKGIADSFESGENIKMNDEEVMSQAAEQTIPDIQDKPANEERLPFQTENCQENDIDCNLLVPDEQSAYSESVESRDISGVSSDEGVVVEASNENTVEIIYSRTPCEENDGIVSDLENVVSCDQNIGDDMLDEIKTMKEERANKAFINLHDHQDLLNQFALFQAFKKLGLDDHADNVYQKLLKNVKERQEKDSTVSEEALARDYMFYKTIKEEEPIVEDWEYPFVIFKEMVVLSKADKYILDDILKSLVESNGVVRLSVSDMYFHYRIELLKYEDKNSEAVALIENIKDQSLLALHYRSVGEEEKADDAEFYARLDKDGGGNSVAETLRKWIEKLMEAAKNYEPRNVYLDSVFG